MVALKKVQNSSDEQQDFEKFIYIISHDVGAIARGLIDLPTWVIEDLEAEDIDIPERVEQDLELIIRQSKRLKNMIDDLREYSRIGRLEEPICLEPSSMVEATLIHHRGNSVDIEWHIPKCKIFIAAQDLERLLEAIISNSIKHKDKPSVRISVSGTVEGNYLKMLFQDDGPGIKPEYRADVFEVMRTLQSRDVIEGSGMGLACAKKVCDTYGGTIGIVEPTNLKGCAVEVKLPLAY